MYLNIMETIYHNPITNNILTGEKWKPFPLKPGMRQGCPISSLLFHIILKFLSRLIRQGEKTKGIQIGKEEVKLSTFADDMILYIKDLENST
jgi:hypothetical protein